MALYGICSGEVELKHSENISEHKHKEVEPVINAPVHATAAKGPRQGRTFGILSELFGQPILLKK
jgi:hypothetical protein